MSFVPLLWIYTQPATRRPTSLHSRNFAGRSRRDWESVGHCPLRYGWTFALGNIFPVFQLDPVLQYFSLLSKSVWDQQEPHGGSFYHLLRSYFY